MRSLTTQIYPSASLALAHQRIAQLRTEAEDARLVRVARSTPAIRRRPAWPAALATALRDSLATVTSTAAGRGRREPCPTC